MKNSSSSIVFKKTWLSLFFAFCIFFTFFFYPQKIDAQNNIGGINLGHLTDYLFVFTNGSVDANWQGATKGFAGNVAINGIQASERNSGSVPFKGTLSTNASSLGAWQNIINQNTAPSTTFSQAAGARNKTSLITGLTNDLNTAFNEINALTSSAGYSGVSAVSLNNLNTQNNNPETFVINITSGFQVSFPINITGDAGDIFILRWDADGYPSNGYQGTVKFQSGGGIVPLGGLIATNFINVAGDINSSGGGDNPPAPYPQGPRIENGTGALISGGKDFKGGGFFTGYWLTTGDPQNGATSSLSNAIFVGGWYSTTSKFSMTSGTSGVYVDKPCIPCQWSRINAITQNITEPTKLGFYLKLSQGNSKNIDLSWTTSSDVNVNHFVIEKSATGEDFYDVGVKVAFGNDANKTTYSFSDNLKNSNELIYYYRIRMVYNDGKEQYSDIQSIRLSKELTEYVSLIAYPNPVSDELLLTIPASWQNKKVMYEIYRADGNRACQKSNNYSSQTELFNTRNLSPGLYIIRAICNGETLQKKIIKR